MKPAPRSHQHHDLYPKNHGHDNEISGLLGECGIRTNPHRDRGFDRDMAAAINLGRAGGPRYTIYKNVIRSYRLYRKGLAKLTKTAAPRHSADSSKRPLLRDVLSRVRNNPYFDRGFDRDMAVAINLGRARGPRYSFYKNLIRAYRLYRKALDKSTKSGALSQLAVNPADGIVLMSHMAIFGSQYFPMSLKATAQRAFICHDVIPVYHPEFAIDSRHAERFRSNLTLLVSEGARALTASETSTTMIDRFGGDFCDSKVRVDKFHMPSLLYAKARELGVTGRLLSDEPYVIYCSTIEVRKNHLLLARIWNRALEEGVKLPKLFCVGRWGWGVEDLQAFLDTHPGLSQCLVFTADISDLELIDLYRGALFGVYPSRVEGWGFGAAECLDFGTPVVVSTAPSLTEAVAGLMPTIDPDDEDGWYEQIRSLAEDQDARSALCRSIAESHRPVSEQASWEEIKFILMRSEPHLPVSSPTSLS